MSLTPLQKQLYEFYVEFENRPLSRWALMQKNWKQFLLLIGGGLIGGLMSFFFLHPFAGLLIFGMCLGGVLNMLGFLFKAVKVWSFLRLVIDWEKLKTLLRSV